ncbi:peptidoglycan-binding protein, partial [Nodosilinea sp. LEGE 07088]|uniref:peptidoglycan-binding protein n=1 Tax=Nodosilinea sp. LEGE 07088 TaxID=2777968 RepID=UPI00187F98D7
MDSLVQCHLWLAWETDLGTHLSSVPPIGAVPLATSGIAPITTARWGRILAIAAGAVVVGSGLGLPALANSSRWGSTVYANTPAGYALNVRWGPSTNNGVYRRVGRGTALQLSGARRNGWVQLVDTTWVAGNLVSSAPIGTAPSWPLPGDPRNLATVVTPQNFALNIRSGAGFEYPVVGQFVNGSRIALTGRFSVGWAQLTNGNWVDSGHLQYSGPVYEVSPPTTLPGQPTNPSPNADVMEVQRRLRQLGYLPASFVITGIYDQTTQNAVREFQRVNGLPVTGTVDAATWQALYRATASPPSPT